MVRFDINIQTVIIFRDILVPGIPQKLRQQAFSFPLTPRNRRSATGPLGLRRGKRLGAVHGDAAAASERQLTFVLLKV